MKPNIKPPKGPPCRIFKACFFGGMRETEESKQATENWKYYIQGYEEGLAAGNHKLLEACQKFIKKYEITCSEGIYQNDNVTLESPEFIEKICKIVGYHKE